MDPLTLVSAEGPGALPVWILKDGCTYLQPDIQGHLSRFAKHSSLLVLLASGPEKAPDRDL